MTTLLFSQTIADKYKETSELVNSVQTGKMDVRVKSMKEIMQESFFHGAGWMGYNFIA